MDNWYVYKHIRVDKDEVFYIGIGNKLKFGRAYEFVFSKRNKIWQRIYEKSEIRVEIFRSDISKIDASILEKELIKIYGRIDLKEGTLSNLTDGGDGIWNCKRSKETKEKLSIGKIGEKNPQFGKKQSEETKTKRIESLTGKRRTVSTKIKQSISSIKSGQAKITNVYDYYTNEKIGTYHSISEACRRIGLLKNDFGKSIMVANGKRNQVKGYYFSYI